MTTASKSPRLRIQRLSCSADFGRVYAAGESVPGKLLVVWRYKRSKTGPARVGVVASKRALGKAHDRNRAKRLLREACRHRGELFLDGFDYVLIARRRIAETKCQDAEGDLCKVMKRFK